MINKFIGVGRLSKDPELRATTTGTTVCNFTIAIQRRFQNSQGEYDADFLNCIAFNKAAELVNTWFKKGDWIGVVGSVQTRTYDDSSGKRNWITEIIVNEVSFVGNKTQSDNLPELPEEFGEETTNTDELPF